MGAPQQRLSFRPFLGSEYFDSNGVSTSPSRRLGGATVRSPPELGCVPEPKVEAGSGDSGHPEAASHPRQALSTITTDFQPRFQSLKRLKCRIAVSRGGLKHTPTPNSKTTFGSIPIPPTPPAAHLVHSLRRCCLLPPPPLLPPPLPPPSTIHI